MSATMEEHYKSVLRSLKRGRVIPFLGAGVNLCDRPPGEPWQGKYLPSGSELSLHLAENFEYTPNKLVLDCPSCKSRVRIPDEREKQDLIRVSQYISTMDGSNPLYEELHRVLDANYSITCVHESLASLPTVLRDKGYAHPYQLIVTTNYDDVLERAFEARGEPCDVLYYEADGKNRGKFIYCAQGREPQAILKPNEWCDLSLDKRTLVMKIHGAINRDKPELDSYVITEDHYISYLAQTGIEDLIPVEIRRKFEESHFLFLGYSLSDWNLRVILQRVWGEQKLTRKSWAILLNPRHTDVSFWNKRDVQLIPMRLEEYVARLKEQVEALPDNPAVK